MFLSGLLGRVEVLSRLRGEAALARIHGSAEFRRLVLRERARSDRSGEQFCLLVFESREEPSRRTLRRLAMILAGRLRITDDLGWLDDGRMAVLLPCTPPAGAWKVADDVCLAFPADEFPPLCTVYAYPEQPGDQPDASGWRSEPAAKPVQRLEVLLSRATPAWKRALDVLGAGVGLVLLAPLLAVVAVAVKLDSPGPVFFRQLRTGRGGRKFHIVKFRTMRVGAEAQRAALLERNEQDGPAFKMRDDPRVTAIGRFLRATSLDELPQLWNVLRGEMSLVGPRPLPCEETDATALWHRRRLDVAPGVTGLWQVRGRCQVAFDDWMRMDLQYIGRQSLVQDLKLIVATLPAVILRRGAH